MGRFAAESKKNFIEITSVAMEKLSAYNWPGNVRELANTIERAVVLGSGPAISLADLPSRVATTDGRVSAKTQSYRAMLEVARRASVARALEQSRGNRAAAAKALGLHEKYFLRLIKTLGIN